jgi:hypothetical protein
MTICSEMAGTELKFSTVGKLRQLRECSREQSPALAFVAAVPASITMARTVEIQTLIRPPKRGRHTRRVNFANRTADVHYDLPSPKKGTT